MQAQRSDSNIETRNSNLNEEDSPSTNSPVQFIMTADSAQDIEGRLRDFTDGIPSFVVQLSDTARLPHLQSSVVSFLAAYSLESSRAETTNKVKFVYSKMKTVMSILSKLIGEKEIDEDDILRLQELSNVVSADIESCANVCDAYSRKSLAVRLLKAPIWDARFASLCAVFERHHNDIQDEFLHEGHEWDAQAYDLESQESEFVRIFEGLISAEDDNLRETLLLIENGGREAEAQLKTFLKDNPVLLEAVSRHASLPLDKPKSGISRDAILAELRSNVVDTRSSEENNIEGFQRRFDALKRQITDEVDKAVLRDSERTINGQVAGPSDKFVDENVFGVWNEMGWEDSVEIRKFILEFKKSAQRRQDTRQGGPIAGQPDDWALKYFETAYLRPLTEAIDENASSSSTVTISDINKFCLACPTDWSFIQWSAYWAVGWYASIKKEAERSTRLCDYMFALLPDTRPKFRPLVTDYLTTLRRYLYGILTSFKDRKIPESPDEKFSAYLAKEENLVRGRMANIGYNIEELVDLKLIGGRGSLEKSFFPSVSLILESHYIALHACQNDLGNGDKVKAATQTIICVYEACYRRFIYLKESWSNKGFDLKKQTHAYALGMFESFLTEKEVKTVSIRKARPQILAAPVSRAETQTTVETQPPIEERAVPDLTGTVVRLTDFASGGGGFADIYMGQWTASQGAAQRVAIKILRPHALSMANPKEINDRINAMLKAEIRVWHSLDHSHVVKLIGTSDGFGPFASMICPWFANGNMPSFIHRHKSLIYSERLRLIREIASGLYYLHKSNVIHGDLSGANVLITDNHNACLSDFGLSVLTQDMNLPSTSSISSGAGGNVRWAAPELYSFADGKEPRASRFTDVYSFGSVAFEAFSGDVPYDYVKNDMDILLNYVIRGIKPRQPTRLKVIDKHWKAIERCWSDDPGKRPASEELNKMFSN